MLALSQVSDLRSFISSAKAAASGNFGTNLFLTDASLEPLVQAGRLSAFQSKGAAIFRKKEKLFDRLYFAAADPAALATALFSLASPESGVLVASLVGRRSDIEPWINQFQSAGFRVHATLLRMCRILPKAVSLKNPDPAVEASTERDTAAVLELLEASFDPYADQIPEVDEIAQAAAQGRILVARDAERIAALLYYDRFGLTTWSRYWLILPEYRTQGLNFKLMERYFQECAGCRRAILWVHESNQRAALIYKWYGYRPDAIVDIVLIKR